MTDTPDRTRVLTYETYGLMLDTLTAGLGDRDFTHVYGPPRGGLPVAVHLSYRLDIPVVTSPEDVMNMNRWHPEDHLLVVDNIMKTGRTVAALIDKLSIRRIRCFTAVLFHKPGAVITPDLHLESTGDWMVFPWEKPPAQS